MNKKTTLWLGVLGILLFSTSSMAQSDNAPSVSKVFATLSKSLDSKGSTIGDEFAMETISDVVVDGQLVIPKNAKFLCHVAGVVTKGKGEPQSLLTIVIDKAVAVGGGRDIPVQAIVVAIAAPVNPLSSDPTYGMMHSNEPKMVGSGPRVTTSTVGLPASSKANSTAAVATAELKGRMETMLLTEDSLGAVGYEGVSISWHLSIPPPLTVFSTKAKNIKLEAGTQMLLRLASPRLPK
jgi:hypothetical protein